MRLRRERRPEVEVAAGERLLAWAETAEGVIAGTRDALYLPAVAGRGWLRVPWEEVEAADWDGEADLLRVRLVAQWGERRPEHTWAVQSPGRLLELLRERVTASVVLQRHIPVLGARGVRVIARRAPSGDRPLGWFVEYDDGVEPADPVVAAAVEAALSEARAEVGEA